MLCEGGPHLLRDLLAAGVVDELCTTIVPRLLGGEHPRIRTARPSTYRCGCTRCSRSDGTLLGRWFV